jgi:hypothetical protein
VDSAGETKVEAIPGGVFLRVTAWVAWVWAAFSRRLTVRAIKLSCFLILEWRRTAAKRRLRSAASWEVLVMSEERIGAV